MIIRPPRDTYEFEDLGPQRFRVKKEVFERTDLELKNPRGQNLVCSHFTPWRRPASAPKLPCVVYCHGNSSSRLEAFDVLPLLLGAGMTVFCFDFSGSGLSDGEYISLGYYEQQDLQVVVDHLRGPGEACAVAVWGRSMGAATTVLRAARDWCIAACVIDSGFGSLQVVSEELLARGKIAVPGFLLGLATEAVRSEVSTRAHFDIRDLTPVEAAANARTPALFAMAMDDELVLPHHGYDLHAAWAGEKQITIFGGGHNVRRPDWFLEQATAFIVEKFAAKGVQFSRRGSETESTECNPRNEVPMGKFQLRHNDSKEDMSSSRRTSKAGEQVFQSGETGMSRTQTPRELPNNVGRRRKELVARLSEAGGETVGPTARDSNGYAVTTGV